MLLFAFVISVTLWHQWFDTHILALEGQVKYIVELSFLAPVSEALVYLSFSEMFTIWDF